MIQIVELKSDNEEDESEDIYRPLMRESTFNSQIDNRTTIQDDDSNDIHTLDDEPVVEKLERQLRESDENFNNVMVGYNETYWDKTRK